MCEVKKPRAVRFTLPVAIILALVAGYLDHPWLISLAETISTLFINLLKLVSLPIIFLSIVSTASGMGSVDEIKHIGKKVIRYTLLTTVIAATVALIIFLIVNPVTKQLASSQASAQIDKSSSYLNYLIGIVPSNVLAPFVENNVIGVFFLAMILSLAILALPTDKRQVLNSFFSALYAAIMKITTTIVQVMPIAIWAFITLFIRDMSAGLEIKSLALYLGCVLAANMVQAFLVLPTLLKSKGIDPGRVFRGMLPALTVAFFTKSSSAALPMAVRCAQNNLGVSSRVANFSLPLCTTINMNACAAFILTTVLFVSMSHGVTYSLPEMAVWVLISTVAAVGNAGVPMGCYFLSGALLASMNVPLNILGVILPFYSLIDMLESAINVWSDAVVTVVVDREVSQDLVEAEPVVIDVLCT